MPHIKWLPMITAAAIVLVPASARAAKDKSKETPGIAAFQSQQGGFKRDRKLTREIRRRERHADQRHSLANQD